MVGVLFGHGSTNPSLTRLGLTEPFSMTLRSRALHGAEMRALSPGLYRATSRPPARDRRALAFPN